MYPTDSQNTWDKKTIELQGELNESLTYLKASIPSSKKWTHPARRKSENQER